VKGTQFQLAVAPGATILKANPKDPATCASAEGEFRKAMDQYPDAGSVIAQMANVNLCQQSVTPIKAQLALFYYARAVSRPLGGIGGLDAAGQKTLDDYLTKSYTTIHGSDEGLAQVKAMAASSPNPPADFKIKSANQINAENEEKFRTENPKLAVWMGIKKSLTDAGGQQYFESNMKGTMLAGEGGAKLLKGTLIEAKPACRPKELLVAVPLPNQPGAPVAEITLRLVDDQMKPLPLKDKPDTGGEISFNGAPSAFTASPFMLTLDSQKADIEGLNSTPCAATATKAPVTKKK
jgi:hypothetical protein